MGLGYNIFLFIPSISPPIAAFTGHEIPDSTKPFRLRIVVSPRQNHSQTLINEGALTSSSVWDMLAPIRYGQL